MYANTCKACKTKIGTDSKVSDRSMSKLVSQGHLATCHSAYVRPYEICELR